MEDFTRLRVFFRKIKSKDNLKTFLPIILKKMKNKNN